MTDRDELSRQAAQCRRLVQSLTDKATVERLTKMAEELEQKVRELESPSRDEG